MKFKKHLFLYKYYTNNLFLYPPMKKYNKKIISQLDLFMDNYYYGNFHPIM